MNDPPRMPFGEAEFALEARARVADLPVPADLGELPGLDAQRVVFRTPRDRSERFGAWGMALGFGIGLIARSQSGQFFWLPICFVLGIAVALFLERRSRVDECSNRDCATLLAAGAALCPGCGRPIAGTIRRVGDRLDAEEEWEDRTDRGLAGPPPRWFRPNPWLGAREVPRSTGEREPTVEPHPERFEIEPDAGQHR